MVRKEEDIKREIRRIMDEAKQFKSRDYKRFMKEERETKTQLNWFERLCKFCYRYIRIDPGKNLFKSLEKDILISGLRVTPIEVSSAVFVTTLSFFILTLPFIIIISSAEKFVFPLLVLFWAYYLLTYPNFKALTTKIRASDESMKVLLYILIFLRLTPDMLGAIKFTATKCHGPIGMDLKKVLWDIEMGRYTTLEDALHSYSRRWILFDESFVKALEMLRGMRFVAGDKQREALLEKTLNFVLDATYKNMRNYTSDLRNPILMIHTMGITLPIFGLILFPLISIFMSGQINVTYIMLGYVVVMPLFLGWYIRRVIAKRPGAFTHPDVHDKIPNNMFPLKIGGKTHLIPLVPLCFFIFLIVAMPGLIFHFIPLMQYYLYLKSHYPTDFKFQWKKVLQEQYAIENLIPNSLLTLSVIFGIALAIIIYFRTQSVRKEKIRKDVEKIEGQFQLMLYQLGDILEANTPIEKSIIYLIQEYERSETKQSEILAFLRKIRDNMLLLHLTFDKSFFDKTYGVVWMYPSTLIKDVGHILVDSARKGPIILSKTSKSISRFLSRLGEVEQAIKEMMDETTSSIKMQIAFIAPFITGIVASASSLLVQMLQQLSLLLERIEQMFNINTTMIGSATSSLSDSLSMIKLEEAMPPTLIQLFVGVYLIEITILLCMLLNGINHGFDKINRDMLISRSLLKSVVMFALVNMIITILFAPVIRQVGAIG